MYVIGSLIGRQILIFGLDQLQISAQEELIFQLAGRSSGDAAKAGPFIIFSILEACRTFSFRFTTGRPFIQSASSKRLHFYYYFMDRDFGLIHVRIPSWFPMQIQVYLNGHEWLARKLAAHHVRFSQLDNVLLGIEDPTRAQKFADRFQRLNGPRILNRYARRVNPQIQDILHPFQYYWGTAQSEYSTDILFKLLVVDGESHGCAVRARVRISLPVQPVKKSSRNRDVHECSAEPVQRFTDLPRNRLTADGSLFWGYHPEMEAVHGCNAVRLQQIIEKHGWPGRTIIGKEAAYAAWIILQHSIGKPGFMRRGFRLIQIAAAEGEIDPKLSAMLEDRTCVFEGRPQKFGTQFDWDENGQMSPNKYDDLGLVEERRRAIGLSPLQEATAEMRAGELWRVITPMFVQPGGISQCIANAFLLTAFMPMVEKLHGKGLLLVFLGAGLPSQIFLNFWLPYSGGAH